MIVPADHKDQNFQFINHAIAYELAAIELRERLREGAARGALRQRLGVSPMARYVGLLAPLLCRIHTDDAALAEQLIADLTLRDTAAAEEEALLARCIEDLLLEPLWRQAPPPAPTRHRGRPQRQPGPAPAADAPVGLAGPAPGAATAAWPLAVGIKGQAGVHHGGNANAAHLESGCGRIFAVHRQQERRKHFAGPAGPVPVGRSGCRCAAGFPRYNPLLPARVCSGADQHCLGAGRAEFDAKRLSFPVTKLDILQDSFLAKRNAVFLIC